jgi:hypothetical protein
MSKASFSILCVTVRIWGNGGYAASLLSGSPQYVDRPGNWDHPLPWLQYIVWRMALQLQPFWSIWIIPSAWNCVFLIAYPSNKWYSLVPKGKRPSCADKQTSCDFKSIKLPSPAFWLAYLTFSVDGICARLSFPINDEILIWFFPFLISPGSEEGVRKVLSERISPDTITFALHKINNNSVS